MLWSARGRDYAWGEVTRLLPLHPQLKLHAAAKSRSPRTEAPAIWGPLPSQPGTAVQRLPAARKVRVSENARTQRGVPARLASPPSVPCRWTRPGRPVLAVGSAVSRPGPSKRPAITTLST